LDKPLTVTIETFDHFTYTLKIGAKTPENDYNLNVAVTADFPTERTPGKDEKPDEKKSWTRNSRTRTQARCRTSCSRKRRWPEMDLSGQHLAGRSAHPHPRAIDGGEEGPGWRLV
jgi:hypothetical protein